jgi:hypothetical protein
MPSPDTSPKPPLPDDASISITQFCELEGISKTFYHKLKAIGRAPKEYRIGSMVRIIESRQSWHARMQVLAQEDAALLEQERRVDQASRAGQAAAQSERHVSNRGRTPRYGA